MAGRFLARGDKLVCLPGMVSEYTPRDSLASLWGQYLQCGEYRENAAVRHPHTMRRSDLLIPALVLTAGAAVAAPRRGRRVARKALGVYAVALAGAGLWAARGAGALGLGRLASRLAPEPRPVFAPSLEDPLG
jgi:hypothetical protein